MPPQSGFLSACSACRRFPPFIGHKSLREEGRWGRGGGDIEWSGFSSAFLACLRCLASHLKHSWRSTPPPYVLNARVRGGGGRHLTFPSSEFITN